MTKLGDACSHNITLPSLPRCRKLRLSLFTHIFIIFILSFIIFSSSIFTFLKSTFQLRINYIISRKLLMIIRVYNIYLSLIEYLIHFSYYFKMLQLLWSYHILKSLGLNPVDSEYVSIVLVVMVAIWNPQRCCSLNHRQYTYVNRFPAQYKKLSLRTASTLNMRLK